jgi:hypothetical protein
MSVIGVEAQKLQVEREIGILSEKKKLTPAEQDNLTKLKSTKFELDAELANGLRGEPDNTKRTGLEVEKGKTQPKVEGSQADIPKSSIDEFEEALKAASSGNKEIAGAAVLSQKEKGEDSPKNTLPPSSLENRKAAKEAREICQDPKTPNVLPDASCVNKAMVPILRQNRELEKIKSQPVGGEALRGEFHKSLGGDGDGVIEKFRKIDEDDPYKEAVKAELKSVDDAEKKEMEKAKPKFNLGDIKSPIPFTKEEKAAADKKSKDITKREDEKYKKDTSRGHSEHQTGHAVDTAEPRAEKW